MPPTVISNGDFEDGLTGWRIVSGKAFAGQPVSAATIGSRDVQINGRPLVGLGGDFWHTPFPIGHRGAFLIRVVTQEPGILESTPFTISLRFLAFRLGGSAGGDAALELRVPSAAAQSAGIRPMDAPDVDGYVAVRIARPSGSDVLRETTWDLGGGHSLLGASGKVRLRVAATPKKPRRLLVDDIRLLNKRPPSFHPPLWGWADIHCHPMAQAGFGDLLAGHMHGPVEDVGSCLALHGLDHGNPLHPVALALDGGRHNDGSLAKSGWTTGTPGSDDELGFRGWPASSEVTHLKTHQSWIRRAYEGGQRLMVALVVHNEMLAAITTAPGGLTSPQSDRDTVEPQVQLLREFIAHNSDWCGLATTPGKARTLIEANKMAFILGLETDSINGWVRDDQFSPDPSDQNREAIHQTIHGYFGYLRDLGIVQINLIHLSDNSFGGMALYDHFFLVNSWQRRQVVPDSEDGWTPHANDDEKISTPVSLASWFWEKVEPVARDLGITMPQQPPGNRPFGHGDRNANGMTVAGEVALLEAMRLGMVVDLDHMSERTGETAYEKAMKTVPGMPYPLVAAHNGARRLAPRPTDETHPPPSPPAPATEWPHSEYRRSPHTWPSESTKSATQLQWIHDTGGMFGHGIAGTDSRPNGSVPNDCPGSSKTVAQGLEFVTSQLEGPVALGTDWNALLTGPGPRFGPRAADGVAGELEHGDAAWQATVHREWLDDALAQRDGVRYDTPIRDWRSYRFPETGLFDQTWTPREGQFFWQALALLDSKVDLTGQDVAAELVEPGATEAPGLELALGLAGKPGSATSDWYRAGQVAADPMIDPTQESNRVQQLVSTYGTIRGLWDAMPGPNPPLRRDAAGPMREYDYNLDGLAHYGLLPDMLQDLKNVGLPDTTFERFFGSAQRYIEVWERCVAVGSRIPHP